MATHTKFNPGSATNSYIQFGNSKIGLDEIKRLDLDNPPVDLLILSACKTAVSQNNDLSHPFYWAGFSLMGNPW